MKIKVIFTGGTIASHVKEDGYIAPKGKVPYELIEQYQKENPNDIKFETIEPYCILSENLTAHELNQLIACVKEVLAEDSADGIIITHGTDTLQYSAAILSYVLGCANIPILLVSSDFPLEDERANGQINFTYAVKFVEGKYGKGVFVSYCNKGGKPVIHRGAKLLQHKAFSADVKSIKDDCYGSFENNIFIYNKEKIIAQTPAELLQENNIKATDKVYVQGKWMFEMEEKVRLSPDSMEILRIMPYVGMEYPSIGESVRVILHESYHSGTIRISDALKKFAKEAKERKIPIYITGLTQDGNSYETVAEYKKMGIIPLLDTAPIAQYCKLWLALSNHKDIERVMKQKYINE